MTANIGMDTATNSVAAAKNMNVPIQSQTVILDVNVVVLDFKMFSIAIKDSRLHTQTTSYIGEASLSAQYQVFY